MTKKDEVRNRLSKLQPFDDIFPTKAKRSENLSRVAESLLGGDSRAAGAMASEHIQSLPLGGDEIVTAELELYENPAIQEQLAGFAAAGINFFKANQEFRELSRQERAEKGGSEIVSNVFVQDNRVLLETSRILVRTNGSVSPAHLADILERHRITSVRQDGFLPDTLTADVWGETALQACMRLMDEDLIEYAEPDFIEHIGQRHTPNDPDFSKQWHHVNIESECAWGITKGQGVRISVIDNGFDINHNDLRFGDASGWFRSTVDYSDADFIPGTNGMPDQNHGTACAGMINAVADNSIGGCGVAFEADLSMVACLGDQVGTQATLARALAYAAQPSAEGQQTLGADIIACSLGPNGANWAMAAILSDTIDAVARDGRDGKGCAIFWACTNGNFPIASDEVCSHPDVIAVGRSTNTDSDDGSGFGDELEFLAPGVDVWIPSSGGGYHYTTGTSFAAPCAAGIAALALSGNPILTASQLRDVMRDTCDKVGPLPYNNGRNRRFGYGRLNAFEAVK